MKEVDDKTESLKITGSEIGKYIINIKNIS